MKLIESFWRFLNTEVNLNKTRIERVKKGIEIVRKFLKNNEIFGEMFVSLVPQGSYRQKTIIKPPKEIDEFDVDLLFQLKEEVDWEPRDYINNLFTEFKESSRYNNIVDRRGKTRCVTLNYSDDFHIDIVPCIERSRQFYIINKNENRYELTDADGYSNWFQKKNEMSNNNLMQVVKLVKYIRDYKKTFSAKSILLTTLIGNQVDKNSESYFSDITTSLKIIFNRLNNFLQANTLMPRVENPALPSEDFNRHWDQAKYSNFREIFIKYNNKVNEAFNEPDPVESGEIWRELFGDEFPVPKKIYEYTYKKNEFTREYSSKDEKYLENFDIQLQKNLKYEIVIDTYVKQSGYSEYSLREKGYPIRKNIYLDFFIKNTNVPEPYRVMWKVRNRGLEAKENNDLRGEITEDEGKRRKKEHTKYSGLHYVECYIIKDNKCVAMDHLEVPII